MFVCVQIHQLILSLAQQGRATGPAVVLEAERVVACCRVAARYGVRSGQNLQQARRLCPEAEILYHDDHGANTLMKTLLGVLEGFTPSVEVVGLGVALCDFGRCDGTNKLRAEGERLCSLVCEKMGLEASVGMASTAFVARVAAGCAKANRVHLVPEGQESAFLADKSIFWLEMDKESTRRLELVGIMTIGQLAALPSSSLAEQFGIEGEKISKRVLGVDLRPLSPLPHGGALSASFAFETPSEGGRGFIAAVYRAVEELFAMLRTKSQLCSRVMIALQYSGAGDASIAVGFASPPVDLDSAWRTIQSRLEGIVLHHPVDGVTVTAGALVPFYASQIMLEPCGGGVRKASLGRVAKRAALMQVVWDDVLSRLPERVAHLEGIVEKMLKKGLCLPIPVSVAVGADGVPTAVKTKTTWRGVQSVMESWELDDEWWTARPIMRTYFRLVLDDGGVFRLFHDHFNGCWYRQSK